jgi:hypothetical protein
VKRGIIYRWIGAFIGLGTTLGLFVIQFGVDLLPLLLVLAAAVVAAGYAIIMLLSRRRENGGNHEHL